MGGWGVQWGGIHEPSKGRPCLFCRGANSRTLGQSALLLVSPPCGLLPAKRKRHSFLRVISEMPVEGDFASLRPSLASPVPAFLVVPGMTGGGVIGEHGFPSLGKSDGVFQVLHRPEKSSYAMVLICSHVDQICVKGDSRPGAASTCIPLGNSKCNSESAQVWVLSGLCSLELQRYSCCSH